jgi:hypothetical protein
MYADAGLRIRGIELGAWCGRDRCESFQDFVIADSP